MTIVVTSTGTDLKSPLDPRFGRARYFLSIDPKTNVVEVVDNKQILNVRQGAGTQAAETVSRLGADAVLTGHCGPNAFRALSAAGIRVITGLDGKTVGEAVDLYVKGEITPSADADVEGHWV
jgi:predicted Fe-Mo cluster-binding NifX family protein